MASLIAASILSGCWLDPPAEVPEQAADPVQLPSGQVRTARWVAESDLGTPGSPSPTDWYFRVEPFAVAWRSTIGRDWSHDLIDQRGHLHTASTWKDVSLTKDHASTANQWLPKVYPWGPFTADLNDLAASPPARAGYQAQAVELKGSRVPKYTHRFVEGNHRVEVAYWLDPASGRTLRTERTETDARTGKVASREIERDFEYDVELPVGAFDLPGKKPLRVQKIEGFPDVTKSFPKKDRAELERLLRVSDEAWMNADFAGFQRSWHFIQRDHSALPREAQWKKWVLQQKGQWRGWRSNIESIQKVDFVSVSVGTHSFSMMPNPNTLMVNTKTRVVWNGGQKEVKAEYYLSKVKGAYRILHWEYPSEELAQARRK